MDPGLRRDDGLFGKACVELASQLAVNGRREVRGVWHDMNKL